MLKTISAKKARDASALNVSSSSTNSNTTVASSLSAPRQLFQGKEEEEAGWVEEEESKSVSDHAGGWGQSLPARDGMSFLVSPDMQQPQFPAASPFGRLLPSSAGPFSSPCRPFVVLSDAYLYTATCSVICSEVNDESRSLLRSLRSITNRGFSKRWTGFCFCLIGSSWPCLCSLGVHAHMCCWVGYGRTLVYMS